MNYYEHHIGDYAEATAHLSFVEDAAYSRLIRKYYSTEAPLPADPKSCWRLVGARTKEERAAVDVVLKEFFELREDGWHNLRCDEELSRYREGEPERAVRKENEKGRLRRYRDERARLFADLHAAGEYPAWNIAMGELRSLHAKTCNGKNAEPATETATAPATLATATHTPVPSPQSPSTRHQTPDTNLSLQSAGVNGGRVEVDPGKAREAFERIQASYPQGLHRGDHWLKAERAVYRLLDQGVTADELLTAVDDYAAQQLALQNTGTERVMRPNNFFEGAAWRGPFPAPKSINPRPRGGRKTFDELKAEREANRAAGGSQ